MWLGRCFQVKPLPHASLHKAAGSFFAADRRNPVHRSADFSLILKPFPRHLVDRKGCIDETRLVPHWLPLPPHPATHQGRHFRLPFSYPRSSKVHEGDRWESEPLVWPVQPAAVRPILRVLVLSTKKRIHKLAVIRHRTRTRLVAALRTALFQLQDAGTPVDSLLDVRRNVVVIMAERTAYARNMQDLVGEMERALRRFTKPHKEAPGAFKKSKHVGPRNSKCFLDYMGSG